MTSYTPEQVEAAAKLLRFDDPSSGDCAHAADILDAYAATLKAAQGGVTEAMVEEVELLRVQVYDLREANADLRERSVALEAALSAQQGQGELQPENSRCPPTYRREEAVKALIGMGWSWDGKQWSVPPAQPAERVPEGEVRLWDTQWLNIVNHDNCYRDWDKAEAINHAVKMTEQAIARNVADGKLPKARAAPPRPLACARGWG